MKNLKVYLMLFPGMALFGSATPLSKIVTKDFPFFLAGGLRVLLAFLVSAPFIRLPDIKKYKGKDAWLLAGIGLIGVLGFTAFMLYGKQLVSGVTGSVIMSATPALTAILSVIFFRDKFSWKKTLAILLAIAGVDIVQPGGNDYKRGKNEFAGILFVIAAIFCEAGYTLMGKALTKEYPPEESLHFLRLSRLSPLSPDLLALNDFEFTVVPGKSRHYLGLYGAVTMGLGSVLWYKRIQQVEGSTAATLWELCRSAHCYYLRCCSAGHSNEFI